MAQTPKSVPTKKTATKPQVSKPKVAAEKKTNKKPAETKKKNELSSSSGQSNYAVPAFLNTQIPADPQVSSTPVSSHSKEAVVDDIESMDFDVPAVNNSNDQQDTAMDVTPAEFAGFIVPSGCGNVLKAERETQGLSLSEVCKSLRLSVNQIQAIEEDDFANLPKQSIVRGFIRNYARLLKMDAEPILKAFQNIVPDEAPLSLSVKATADESVIGAKEMKFTPKIIANIAFVIVVLFALAYLYTHYIKPHAQAVDGLTLNADEIQKISPDMMPLPLPNAATAEPENEATPTALVENTTTTETVVSDNASDVQSSMTSTFERKLNTQTTTENTQIVTTPPATKPSPAPSASTSVTPLPGESQLSFKLAEQSWVRVETADGKKIFSELLQAGSQTLNAKPPFTIIIGNASATKVAINNLDYDLTPVTRANVARVQVK